MTLNIEGLQRLADKRPPESEWAWMPPVAADFAEGQVLAFDQSLASTGVVWLVSEGGRLEVRNALMLRTTYVEGKGGHEENLQRAIQQAKNFEDLLKSASAFRDRMVVVHESPPDGGGKLERPESSLLAALSLRLACGTTGFRLAPQVAIRAHRKLVCGDGRADKTAAHRVLNAWAPDVVGRYERVSNSDKRDALCVGLHHLHRGSDGR